MSAVFAVLSLYSHLPIGIYSTLEQAKAAGAASDAHVKGDLDPQWCVARYVMDAAPGLGGTIDNVYEPAPLKQ